MSERCPPFLETIPLELRKMIYQEFFKSSTATVTRRSSQPNRRPVTTKTINLLRTCKAVKEEAEEFFRPLTQFVMTQGTSAPITSLFPSLQVSNLTVRCDTQAYMDSLTQALVAGHFNGSKLENLTIVSKVAYLELKLMFPLSAWNPLGNYTKKLTQIITGNDSPISDILRASNPNQTPQSLPVSMTVLTTTQIAVANITRKIDIFVGDKEMASWMYRIVNEDVRGRSWLLNAEIVVYVTGSWPYERFSGGFTANGEIRLL